MSISESGGEGAGMAGVGLQGRVAVVTGGTDGIGKAIALRFLAEGAKVAVTGRHAEKGEKLLAEVDSDALAYFSADASSVDSAQRVVAGVHQRFGPIHILVNNVGFYHEEPFELISFEEWKRMLSVNLDSLFLTSKAVLPVMKSQGFGRIIALSSDTIWLGTPYLVHYITSKMGVIGFVRSLSSEVGKYGITVNAITVGLTATQRPANEKLVGSILEHLLPQQAVQRADEPEDIAGVVAFLASPESSIITGQTINVDGGVARH